MLAEHDAGVCLPPAAFLAVFDRAGLGLAGVQRAAGVGSAGVSAFGGQFAARPAAGLELGHCLRLPAEGSCECDLYLSCAKFVTTPGYARRLRQRAQREQTLLDDARHRGWDREIQRHQAIITRVEGLLTELGQPLRDTGDGIDSIQTHCPGETT
jgi:hypothetical protein